MLRIPSPVRGCCRFSGFKAMAYPLRGQPSGETSGHSTRRQSRQIAGYPANGRGSNRVKRGKQAIREADARKGIPRCLP
jgi:hypothetical protein